MVKKWVYFIHFIDPDHLRFMKKFKNIYFLFPLKFPTKWFLNELLRLIVVSPTDTFEFKKL